MHMCRYHYYSQASVPKWTASLVFIEYAGGRDNDDEVFALSISGGPSTQSRSLRGKVAPELLSAPSEFGGNSYWAGKHGKDTEVGLGSTSAGRIRTSITLEVGNQC
jgi:hypothetical protein